MNPITHLLASWELANTLTSDPRDRRIVAWAGLAPDLDGLGLVVDVANKLLGRPESWWFGAYHHVLGHGLLGAVLAGAAAGALGRERRRAALGAFAAVHLHLVCDLVGSRGPAVDDIWPIHYLGPFSERLSLSWAGQWPVNGWPNIAFTLVLLAVVFARAARTGYSPVELFGRRAEGAFVGAVRARWARIRKD